jgi:PAS domain S-box-containing protein
VTTTSGWSPAEEIDSLARELVHAYEELHLLYGLGEALGDRLSVAAGAEIILEQTMAALHASRAELRLADAAGTTFVRPAGAFYPAPGPAERLAPVSLDRRLTADLRGGGGIVGTIELLRSADAPAFSSSDGKLLDAVGALAGGALRNAQLYEQLSLQAEALRQREAHLSAVLDHVADGVIAIDGNGVIRSFNRAAEQLYGITSAEAAGTPVELLFGDSELLYGDLAVGLGPREATARRPDGRVFPAELVVTDLRMGSQRLFILSVQDITERKETAETLLRTERMRALGQLASGVAHDLNQSLSIIAGFADLAKASLERPSPNLDTMRQQLGLVVQAAMDGSETVNRLLRFGRGHRDGEQTAVELAAILRDVADMTAPRWRDAAQAEGRTIDMVVDADSDTYVRGWAASLRELFTNLVLNAIDAMPNGGTIRLRARRVGDATVAEVTDGGTGMTPEVRDRIFEPFFSTKGARGTGLGLAMVFGIVEQHGGTVDVDTAPGVGTTFRLRFPATSSEPTLSAPVPVAAPVALRVLAVDDRPEITMLLEETLVLEGHEVVVASSGEEALQVLQRERFDVLVSDIGLGSGMTGWELVDRVRATWPETRLIVATGWGAQVDDAEARARGVEAVIAKPFRPAELRRAVAGGGERRGGTPSPVGRPDAQQTAGLAS